MATFGTALDVTVADLSIESFYPADDATPERLQAGARYPSREANTVGP